MAMFGSYAKYAGGQKEEAKRELKVELRSLIDKLCERDDFWIEQESRDPFRPNTIGWKIDIPHMKEKGDKK